MKGGIINVECVCVCAYVYVCVCVHVAILYWICIPNVFNFVCNGTSLNSDLSIANHQVHHTHT